MPDYIKPFFEAAVMLAVLIVLTRIRGLRSFTKMSSFDFAVTVSIGSILASIVVLPEQGLLVGIPAVLALFLMQGLVAHGRVLFPPTTRIVDNTPLLLMRGSEFLTDNMKAAEMTRGDIMGKLREANVTSLDQVRAVVLERTGDVSVLHSSDLDETMIEDVIADA